MYYGAYEGLPKASTTTHSTLQRQASSASTKKGRRLLPDNSGFSSSSNSMMVQSNLVDKKAKKQLIKEAEMEFKLRGKFKRVFPSIDYHYYKQFFTEERVFNAILDEKLMSKRRLGN